MIEEFENLISELTDQIESDKVTIKKQNTLNISLRQNQLRFR